MEKIRDDMNWYCRG